MAAVIFQDHIFLNRKQQMTRMTITLTSNAMEAEKFRLEQRGTKSPISELVMLTLTT